MLCPLTRWHHVFLPPLILPFPFFCHHLSASFPSARTAYLILGLGTSDFVAPPLHLCSTFVAPQSCKITRFYAGCSTVAPWRPLTHPLPVPPPPSAHRPLHLRHLRRAGEAQPDVTAMSTSFHSYSVLVRIFHVFAPICRNLQFFAVIFALLR